MLINTNLLFKKGLTLFFCGISFFMFGQGNPIEKQINTVFNQLVLAYGSAKPAPQLTVVMDKPKKMKPAEYIPFLKLNTSIRKPNIKIDAYLFVICRSFGKDSLNALSIVISHELAHYYGDHTFCMDYAFALSNKKTSLKPALRNIALSEGKAKETEADRNGFFYSAAAGFSPFDLESPLIDKIYKEYAYPDVLKGYPTKQERKDIAKDSEAKAKELFSYFQEGLKAMEEKQYDVAIIAFQKANSYTIPYRENLNNIGVAKTRQALNLKDPNKIEKESPERFLYPIEIENKSRLSKEITRGNLDDTSQEMEKLLKDAQKDFQEAIRLDPNFTKGYINLACVLDLLGNYPKSIGTIFELSKENQNTIEAKRILAIAYFHNKQNIEANFIWNELKM